MFESILEAITVQAYRETEYRVLGVRSDAGAPRDRHAPEAFNLKIGESCADLAAAHLSQRVDCSAFITACDPYSQMLDDPANSERHAALRREIEHLGLLC